MAESPTHKFGQIIGSILEASMEEPLTKCVTKLKGYYLDKKGHRKTRGNKKKLSWVDKYGNTHDLDFVIERGGNATEVGSPAAFIEIAWRRYTKHSRNKAQEMQGAILPLAETYNNDCPFLGVIIAGDFTQGSLNQLESLGFTTLYFDYQTIKDAFSVVGINAHFEEGTADEEVSKKIEAFESLTIQQKNKIKIRIKTIKRNEIKDFINKLRRSILRKIDSIRIIALHGQEYVTNDLNNAIEYINNYDYANSVLDFIKYEIYVKYSNGDRIDAFYQNKEDAISFLRRYRFCI